MTDQLRWPPTKEDLEKLYVIGRLSAAKIAKVYGLKYANVKTAESTVLHHLKKNGIRRRDKADHVRKITKEMVDGWILRYQKGESLKEIAGKEVNPVSVWNHLRARGVMLRNRVEAQIKAVTKHQRRPFAGSMNDEAYMVGFTKGDCQILKHGRAVRVRTSTTHRAQAELFDELFSQYGFVHRYPSPSKLTDYEWHLEVDLDETFSFLLLELDTAIEKYWDQRVTFFHFLSGFFDAEGSILFHKKGDRGGFELSVTNMNNSLLESLAVRLRLFGYGAMVRLGSQKLNRGVKNGNDHIWKLVLFRSEEVHALLGELRLRHSEKMAQSQVATRLPFRPESLTLNAVREQWTSLKGKIKAERDSFVMDARNSYLFRRKS